MDFQNFSLFYLKKVWQRLCHESNLMRRSAQYTTIYQGILCVPLETVLQLKIRKKLRWKDSATVQLSSNNEYLNTVRATSSARKLTFAHQLQSIETIETTSVESCFFSIFFSVEQINWHVSKTAICYLKRIMRNINRFNIRFRFLHHILCDGLIFCLESWGLDRGCDDEEDSIIPQYYLS